MKTFHINFECPECGHDTFLEYREAIVGSPVTHFEETEKDLYPICGEEYVEDWASTRLVDFMCQDCGYTLPPNDRELFNWLKERGMIEEAK